MKLRNTVPFLFGPIRRQRRSQALRRLLSEFVKPGDLVFDVGANEGDMAREFVALGTRIVAFEPQRKCQAVLASRFRGADVVIDPRALSDTEGTATLRIPQAPTIASMAPDWIDAVKASGRFSEFDWADTEEIQTTRLQSMIELYGEPAFCKIDVEGNEEAVIAGLNAPVRALSLEFTPEHREGLVRAVDHLGTLGEYHWNFVPFGRDGADTCRLEFEQWMPSPEFREFLRDYPRTDAGNVYGRLTV